MVRGSAGCESSSRKKMGVNKRKLGDDQGRREQLARLLAEEARSEKVATG